MAQLAQYASPSLAASLAQIYDDGDGVLLCTGFVVRVVPSGEEAAGGGAQGDGGGGGHFRGAWVLTAAHCLARDRSYSVRMFAGAAESPTQPSPFGGAIRADDPRWQRIPPGDIRIHVHPGFSMTTLRNDVALLFCRIRSTALLASLRPLPIRRQAPGGASTIVGFSIVNGGGGTGTGDKEAAHGAPSTSGAPVLKTAAAEVGSGRGRGLLKHMMFDPRWHVWAAGAVVSEGRALDTCEGDSGGPLLDGTGTSAIAVTSWGVECGSPEMPGVYARLGPLMGPEPEDYTLRRVRAGSPWRSGIEGVMAAAHPWADDPANSWAATVNSWADDPAKPTVGAALEAVVGTPVIVFLLLAVMLLATSAAATGPGARRTALLVAAAMLLVLIVTALLVTYCV